MDIELELCFSFSLLVFIASLIKGPRFDGLNPYVSVVKAEVKSS